MEEVYFNLIKSIPAPILFCDQNGEVAAISDTLSSITGKFFEKEINLKNLFPNWDLQKASHFFANLGGREVQVVYSPFIENNSLKGGFFYFSFLEHTEKTFSAVQKERSDILNFIVRGLAHDFRNFLFAVQGYLELAQIAYDEERQKKYLLKAKLALSRAKEFAENLMTDNPNQKFDLYETLQEVFESILDNKNIKWTLYIPENVWPPKIDKIHLIQIFINLVKNSLEAMPTGGYLILEVENVYLTYKKRELNPGPYLRFTLIDSGIGIKPSDLPLVFIPYFSSKDKVRGLGLAMVKYIVKSHGGEINIESEPGEGTKIEIFLPAAQENSYFKQSDINNKKSPELNVYVIPKKHILLLEDEPEIGSFLKETLEFMGYKVTWKKNPDQALNIYKEFLTKKETFDFVISDYHLPKMNGLEFLVEIKNLNPKAKILITTGERDKKLEKTLKEAGALKVLVKPFSIKELAEALSNT
ncbi:PAS/PAC sensor hybrid histidine kinase [Thermodesulfatator indicus DSM 15286]|uniref:histidine kinase n=1 Tax=Thermodesulfatator indicus (strain DSM 15286 / JCM 11887 / CIR29812) TaxID=667014 RepID=F8AD54_THEID|nr:response regulator [Thermodesulfatator indicus]AEH44786.1 PAS/PAC sensor hybrid histidine kinase [Thermodesulfatator indicus DSM 15286]